jgi:DNA-binding CsgD family transcriptional regulator
LTGRERDILALAGRGLTNQEIADELVISARTVKCTLHRASGRLGAHNRTQAVIVAIRQGDLHLLDMFSADELAELIGSMPPEVLDSIYDRVERDRVRGRLSAHPAYTEKGNGNQKQAKGGVECVF